MRKQSDPAAHAVIATTVAIDPQCKLTSVSPENGCRILGASQNLASGPMVSN